MDLVKKEGNERQMWCRESTIFSKQNIVQNHLRNNVTEEKLLFSGLVDRWRSEVVVVLKLCPVSPELSQETMRFLVSSLTEAPLPRRSPACAKLLGFTEEVVQRI